MRIEAIGFAAGIHLLQLLPNLVQFRSSSLQVYQFCGNLVSWLTIVEQLVDAVIHIEFRHGFLNLSVEFGQQLLDSCRRPGLVPIGTGQHAGSVNAQFRKFGDSHFHGISNHLPIDATQLRTVFPAKFTNRGVVDGPPRDEPYKIEGVFDVVFDLPAAAKASCHREQQNFAQNTRMNGRLADLAIIAAFPFAPVESIENLIEQPDRMIVRDSVFDTGGNQHELFARHRSTLPIIRFDRSFRHDGSSVHRGIGIMVSL